MFSSIAACDGGGNAPNWGGGGIADSPGSAGGMCPPTGGAGGLNAGGGGTTAVPAL